MNDALWMREAISEGQKGRINAPPNPWVGCVIVKNDQIVGKGFHPECGQPHAEVFALNDAGEKAKGATAYVTLEPCSHTGRTPPCVNALINAEVSRVVIGVEDPDEKVSGKGIAALKEAGIKVVVGVEREKVEKDLEPYLFHRRFGRPFVIGKTALSIDGRAAASDGSSQWISCQEARKDAHRLRAESQAVLIGSGTAVKDSPRLTVRDVDEIPKTMPLRVLLDRSGIVPHDSPLFQLELAPTLVFSNSKDYPTGVEVVSETDLKNILENLGKRGVLQILIEGGPTVLSDCIEKGIVNRLIVYTGSKVLGEKGSAGFKMPHVQSIDQAIEMRLEEVAKIGNSVRSIYSLS